MSDSDRLYHVGFGPADLYEGTTIALLSGDPDRSELGGGLEVSAFGVAFWKT